APYLRTLNSGAALLAASFRRPLVAPRIGGVAETFSTDPSLLYSGETGDALVDAMARAMTTTIGDHVFEEILQVHRPESVSREFFKAVRERCLVPADWEVAA